MNMKHLYTSLGSGITSGSVTDNSITDDSVIEIYFDNTDCYIDTTSQSGHTVYFTVGGNTTGTNVCVVVNNLTDFTPYNDADIQERVDELETTIEELETTIDGLNASNISYDEHSTLYSAMGDIDSLETTSKNLVGAINEVKGSGGGSQEVYDDTERVIGTWFGKSLYRKVFTTNADLSFSGSVGQYLQLPTIPTSNIDVLVDAYVIRGKGTVLSGWIGYTNNTFNFMNFRNASWTLESGSKIVTLYTKVGE